MLENLDKIDWAQFEDAYGPATKLPDHLRGLLAAKPGDRRRALAALTNAVNHQGLITPVAVPVAPLLVELAGTEAVPDRGRLFGLLGDLAVGGNHIQFLTSGCVVTEEDLAAVPDEVPFKVLYLAVEAGTAAYLRALAGEDVGVRMGAAFVLAFLSTKVLIVAPALRERVERETNEKARASAVLALGMAGIHRGTAEDAGLFEQLRTDQAPLVRFAALIALANVAPERLGSEGFDELIGRVEKGGKPIADFPWCEGELDNHAAMIVAQVAAARGELAYLYRLLDATKGRPTQQRIAVAVLHAAFAGDPPDWPEPRSPADLSDVQRRLLQRLIDDGLIFRVTSALAAHGLLAGDQNIARWIGNHPRANGPVDAEVGGRPLWALLMAVVSERATVEKWREALARFEPERVLAICEDAAVPPYALNMVWPPRPLEGPTEHDRHRARLHGVLSETLIAHVGAELLEPAAMRWLDRTDRPASLCAMLAEALSVVLDRAGRVADQRLDPLIAEGISEPYVAPMRRVLAKLPEERRASLVLALKFNHYLDPPNDGGPSVMRTREAWHYLDLVPTEAAATKLLAEVRTWRSDNPGPEDRAVEILIALGPAARGPIDEALADSSFPCRSVLERARVGGA